MSSFLFLNDPHESALNPGETEFAVSSMAHDVVQGEGVWIASLRNDFQRPPPAHALTLRKVFEAQPAGNLLGETGDLYMRVTFPNAQVPLERATDFVKGIPRCFVSTLSNEQEIIHVLHHRQKAVSTADQ